MLDIGLFELLLIGIVALLVLGPEKMPSAIRTTVLWVGRAKRSFNKVRSEIEQQIDADDIRRQLHNESILADIEKAKKNANKLIEDTQSEIDETRDQVKRNVDDIKKMPTVTNSAEEGIPTGEQDIPETTETINTAEANNMTSTPATTELPDQAVEPTSQTEETSSAHTIDTDTSDDEPALTKKDKPVVEDFYNTPPEGIVSIQGSTVVGKKQEGDDNDDSEADSAKS
jgi:sec-independent protein translocase protein TatB